MNTNNVESSLGYVITFAPNQFSQPRDFRYIPATEQLIQSWISSPQLGRKEGSAVCAARFYDDAQTKDLRNAEHCWAIILDFDHCDVSLEWALKKLSGVHCFAWSTYNNEASKPRWRLVVPLKNPIPVQSYFPIWKRLDEDLGEYADTSASDGVRIGYLPRLKDPSAKSAYRYAVQSGDLFDPLEHWGLSELPVEQTWADGKDRHKIGGVPEGFIEPLSWPNTQERVNRARRYFEKVGHGTEEGGRHAVLFKAACKLWWDFAINDDAGVLSILEDINDRFNPPKSGADVWTEVLFGYQRTIGPHAVPQDEKYGNMLEWQPPAPERRVVKDTRFGISAPWVDEDVPEWMDDAEEVRKGIKPVEYTIDVDEDGKRITVPAENPNVIRGAIPRELIEDAPGLIGWIAQFICETAMRPLPLMAVAAALSAVSALAARRFCTDTSARSNLWVVGIAPTGAGKAAPRNALTEIFNRAENCASYLGPSEIASGAGLFNQFVSHPVKLFPLDEFGMMLAQFKSRNTSDAKAEVIRRMMQLFTESDNSRAGGTAYSSKEDVRISYPSLSIFATTTASEFFGALSGNDKSSGLVNRMLVWTAPERGKYADNKRRFARDVPKQIIHAVERIHQYTPKTPAFTTNGGKAGVRTNAHNSLCAMIPDVVQFTPEAYKLQRQILMQIEDEIAVSESAAEITARHHELVLKVALCSAIARYATEEATMNDDDTPMIDEKDVRWAQIAVAFHRGCIEEGMAGGMANNEAHAINNTILHAIAKKREEGISRSELTRAVYAKVSDGTKRNKALETLKEAGFIAYRNVTIGGSQKPTQLIFCTKLGYKELGLSSY